MNTPDRIGPPLRIRPIPPRVISEAEFDEIYADIKEMTPAQIARLVAEHTDAEITPQRLADAVRRAKVASYSDFLRFEGVFPGIETRPMTELVRSMDIVTRPDGRKQYVLPGEPTLPTFDPPARWKPKHAAQLRALMAGLFASAYGILWTAEVLDQVMSTFDDGKPMPYDEMDRAVAQDTYHRYQAWSSPDTPLILADDDFVTMVRAAALSASTESLSADELLAPSGILLFENETIVEQIHPSRPFRGIRWQITDGDRLTVEVLLENRHLDWSHTVLRPDEVTRYLVVKSFLSLPLGYQRELDLNGPSLALVGMLRSVAAISRSPRTTDRTVDPGAHSRKKGRRQSRAPGGAVRVLALRSPETARMEYEAATGTGSTSRRQHWVRGHWRRQWYPSLGEAGEHRRIWVDGFLRGDATLGTVAADRVYRANGG